MSCVVLYGDHFTGEVAHVHWLMTLVMTLPQWCSSLATLRALVARSDLLDCDQAITQELDYRTRTLVVSDLAERSFLGCGSDTVLGCFL